MIMLSCYPLLVIIAICEWLIPVTGHAHDRTDPTSIIVHHRYDFCIGRQSLAKGVGIPESQRLALHLREVSGGGFERQESLRLMVNQEEFQGSASLVTTQDEALLPDIVSVNQAVSPNVTDKGTVLNLAKMTSDAYVEGPENPGWQNTTNGFEPLCKFGWDSEGLRGHVFGTHDNSTLIVSFKGTTIDPRAQTRSGDRYNDIILFSCCGGAQQPYHYSPVCNCSSGYYQCDFNCLTQTLLQNDTYYDVAIRLLSDLRLKYRSAKFWTVGHSLGGSIASLVGLTFNIPAITFEAPPERLPAQRLGLLPERLKTKDHPARVLSYHFGNTADPVYMGTCNGYLSSCSIAGFNFESQCHSGRRCPYQTVRDKGWHMSIANHRISTVIKDVIEVYETVPVCEDDDVCEDCFNWKFS